MRRNGGVKRLLRDDIREQRDRWAAAACTSGTAATNLFAAEHPDRGQALPLDHGSKTPSPARVKSVLHFCSLY